jgi:tRNA1Val (adenine37-N6)-methyltransferase
MDMNVILSADERLDKINENLTIIQKKQGLTFGSDTYLLSAFIKNDKYGRAADLGSGTGVASLLCAARGKFKKIYAVEIQKSFCELIEKNTALNSLSDVITTVEKDVREVFPSDTDGELDAVFSNPPYMKVGSGKRNEADEKYIARHEVFGGIDDFCAAAARLLKFGGRFYCVYRPDRLSELMAALGKYSLEPKRMTFVHADVEASPSAVLIEAKKGASPSLVLTKPLIIHASLNSDGSAREMTDSAKEIYDTCSFENFK